MKIGALFMVSSIVGTLFGVAFVVAPAATLVLYGSVTPDAVEIGLTQLLGAAFVGYGVFNWYGRGVTDPAGVRALAMGNLAGDAIGAVFATRLTLSGTVNALGWSSVAIYGLFALGFAYFLFMKPAGAPAAAAKAG